MKKHMIIMIIAIFVLLLGGFFYQNKNVGNIKKEVELPVASYDAVGVIGVRQYIYKTDEDGNPLNGVRFEASTHNNTFQAVSDYNPSYYEYELQDAVGGPDYFEDAYDALSFPQRDFLKNFTTAEDIIEYFDGEGPMCFESDMLENIYNSFYSTPVYAAKINPSNLAASTQTYYCYIPMPTYFTIEETRVPTGFVKEKVLVPGMIIAGYRVVLPYVVVEDEQIGEEAQIASSGIEGPSYDLSELPAELYGIGVISNPSDYKIKYGNVDTNLLVGTDMGSAANVWITYNEGTGCEGLRIERDKSSYATIGADGSFADTYTENANRVFFQSNSYNICMVNQKGKVKLEANSYVNNVESITTNINQTLEYKVVVKNIGQVDSVDNVIRSTLPEGFIYIEDSATLGGTYKNGFVEWNVGRIKEGENVELTYKAYAPRGANIGQDYIGTTSVEGLSLENKVEANKTMVRLSLNNPKTGVSVYVIVFVTLISFLIVLIGLQQFKVGKLQQQKQG